MEYVKDIEATKERLGEMVEAVRFAEYELTASIALLRVVGVSWQQIGEGMGYEERNARQLANQWFKRHGSTFGVVGRDGKPTVEALDETDEDGGQRSERQRLGRVLALGEKVSRYQVRLIESGRRGVNRVVYRIVSTHLKLDTAERRAIDEDAELWRIEPNGDEVRMKIRRKTAPTIRGGCGDETPF